VPDAILDLRPFFIIVPGRNHHERHRRATIIVFLEQTECVFESFSAATVHVPIQAPRRFAVIDDKGRRYEKAVSLFPGASLGWPPMPGGRKLKPEEK